MKRIALVLVALLVAATLFADISGSVTTTTAYDMDAETFAETIDTSVVVGPLTIANKIVFTAIGADDRVGEETIDWTGAVEFALNEAITIGISSTYGIDSTDIIPLTLDAAWVIGPMISVSLQYAHTNINADEPEIGTITVEATLTF